MPILTKESDLQYFNPRSPKGATDSSAIKIKIKTISIHAPRRERQNEVTTTDVKATISIHAPRRERQWNNGFSWAYSGFQSTLPEGSDREHVYIRQNIFTITAHIAQYKIQKTNFISLFNPVANKISRKTYANVPRKFCSLMYRAKN